MWFAPTPKRSLLGELQDLGALGIGWTCRYQFATHYALVLAENAWVGSVGRTFIQLKALVLGHFKCIIGGRKPQSKCKQLGTTTCGVAGVATVQSQIGLLLQSGLLSVVARLQ